MRKAIFEEIVLERERQDAEWGGPPHDDSHEATDWIAYLAKHLGRAVTLEPEVFRRQMVIVAALAVAAVEWCGRRVTQ